MEKIWLTTAELAERWYMTVPALHAERHRHLEDPAADGLPPGMRRGKRWLYRIADVEAWESERVERDRLAEAERLERERLAGRIDAPSARPGSRF